MDPAAARISPLGDRPPSRSTPPPGDTAVPCRRVSLVTTVLNDAPGINVVLHALIGQTRLPDEIIVVDGGSTDRTVNVILDAARRNPRIRLILAPGANIGRGRNIGIEAATGDVIVSTDTGCRLEPRWLERITQPFEDDRDLDFVAGFYEIEPHSLLEAVVGTATMRGALDPVDPETFNPSCRSVAYTKALWERAGRFPEWTPIDDTLFNMKIRRMQVSRRFVPDAVVHWRPRSTLAGVYRQFRFYASTRGHTQLGAESLRYNLRNLVLCVVLLLAGFAHPVAWGLLLVAAAYFFVLTFHDKSRRVAAKLRTWRAYPLSLAVHWAIVLGGVNGYIRASIERRRRRDEYERHVEDYLGVNA